jgi:hypothetical protein
MSKASDVAFVGRGAVRGEFITASYAYIGGSGWRVEYRHENGELLARDPSPRLALLEPTAADEAFVVEHARRKVAALEQGVMREARELASARSGRKPRPSSLPN